MIRQPWAVTCCLLLSGCGSSTEPRVDPLIGTYVLVRINDKPVPVLTYTDAYADSQFITADTLFLQRDSVFTETLWTRLHFGSGGQADHIGHGHFAGTWTHIGGSGLHFDYDENTVTDREGIVQLPTLTVMTSSGAWVYQKR